MTPSDVNSPGHGLVFDIKRYAINDGPGIRVVVFFKGCNLHCAWCHNPEGISAGVEKMYSPAKCIKCGTCVAACPVMAISMHAEGIRTDRDLCTLCARCADVCPTKAIEMSGKSMPVSEIIEIIEKERPFFDQSGGGVTFSGGEPLVHSKMLIELLDACGERGIHRAVDTAGHINSATLMEVARRTDLFLYDLKMMDPILHEKWTGVTNDLVLRNLRMLCEAGSPVIIRIPLIAEVNDAPENIRQTAEFIASLAGEPKEVHLIPYHAIAQHKYAKLGKNEAFVRLEEPGRKSLERIAGFFAEYGITARVGG
ncbi:MAG: glycyl-radical enzyme activating protein [Bacteroidetes bacterium]|nr:glycyl-radical enzyme activating protein [Bacteroidota bacterium]